MRLLLVGRELRRRGADVAFTTTEYDPLLTDEGFRTFLVPEVVLPSFDRNLFGAYTPELVDACVEAELRAVATFQPDVLVSDLRPSARITANCTQIAHVSIINASLSRGFDPALLLADRPASRRLAASLGQAVQHAQKRTAIGAFRTIARRRGVSGLNSLDDLLEGERTLLADLFEFCPVTDLPSTSSYIGPLIWDGPAEPTDSAAESTKPGRPLIYVTTGNTGNPRLVDLALQAFADDDDLNVLITTGAYHQVPTTTVPAHIRVERFVPGPTALASATAAVHCGGSGTTYQVLRRGLPSVILPANNDQRINAALVMRHQLGIALDPGVAGPRHLQASVQKVVHSSQIRAHLDVFQRLVNRSYGASAAADRIEWLHSGQCGA